MTINNMLTIAKSGKKNKEKIKADDIEHYERLIHDVQIKETVALLYYEMRCFEYEYKK